MVAYEHTQKQRKLVQVSRYFPLWGHDTDFHGCGSWFTFSLDPAYETFPDIQKSYFKKKAIHGSHLEQTGTVHRTELWLMLLHAIFLSLVR